MASMRTIQGTATQEIREDLPASIPCTGYCPTHNARYDPDGGSCLECSILCAHGAVSDECAQCGACECHNCRRYGQLGVRDGRPIFLRSLNCWGPGRDVPPSTWA